MPTGDSLAIQQYSSTHTGNTAVPTSDSLAIQQHHLNWRQLHSTHTAKQGRLRSSCQAERSKVHERTLASWAASWCCSPGRHWGTVAGLQQDCSTPLCLGRWLGWVLGQPGVQPGSGSCMAAAGAANSFPLCRAAPENSKETWLAWCAPTRLHAHAMVCRHPGD